MQTSVPDRTRQYRDQAASLWPDEPPGGVDGAEFWNAEPLSVTDRQALALRQEFVRAHPESPWTESLAEAIEEAEVELEETLALRRVRGAERALDGNRPGLAVHRCSEQTPRSARSRERSLPPPSSPRPDEGAELASALIPPPARPLPRPRSGRVGRP